MSAACKYDYVQNSYNAQRIKFWARKMRDLTPEEFQKLVAEKKPEKEILDKAREENGRIEED